MSETSIVQQPNWTVIGQRKSNQTGPDGNLVSGWEIRFQTQAGDVGSVFVTDASYNAKAVAMLIDDRVATMNSIRGLSG